MQPTGSVSGQDIEQPSVLPIAVALPLDATSAISEHKPLSAFAVAVDPQRQGTPAPQPTQPRHHYVRTFIIVFIAGAVLYLLLAKAAKK